MNNRFDVTLAKSHKSQKNVIQDYAYFEFNSNSILLAYHFKCDEYIDESDKSLGTEEHSYKVHITVLKKNIDGIEMQYDSVSDIWKIGFFGSFPTVFVIVDTEKEAIEIHNILHKWILE